MTDIAIPTAANKSSTWTQRFAGTLTLEKVLWGVLILFAVWTRFWQLGARAQHHDESLHSYYSWIFSTGERLYVHNPLMHGPFLFHATALVYKLFGATDTTSRLLPAAFGVAIVWMPWLLRSPRMLGRWGALFAGWMLLISPSMLYYTRYIRHDPFMVAGCLLLAIAIFRYMEVPQRRWLITAFVTGSFLLTNHELVLATFLIMTVVLWGSLLLTYLRQLIAIHLIAILLLGVAAFLWMDEPFPPIPWQRPAANALTSNQFLEFVAYLGPVFLAVTFVLIVIAVVKSDLLATVISAALMLFGVVWLYLASGMVPEIPAWQAVPESETSTYLTTSQFYWALFSHPFVQAFLAIVVIFLIGCFVTVRWMLQHKPEEENGIDYLFGDAPPNSVAYGLRHALHDPLGLAIGFFVAVFIWILLFTTIFTNPNGIGTGTYETNSTLLYWLGQHDVRRGSQPWFYFITLGWQYEWLAYVLGAAGTILIGWRLVRWIAGGQIGKNALWNCFIVAWFVGTFLVLSWAGEKMPWLVMHIVLPAALIGGWLINSVVEGGIRWYHDPQREHSNLNRYGTLTLFAVLVLLAGSWFYMTAGLSYPNWEMNDVGQWVRTIPASALSDWWHIAIAPLLALFAIAGSVWLIGPTRVMYATLAASIALMSLFQVHTGFRMSYLDGDVAVDTLIYNTISGDMTQFVGDMNQLSEMTYGDNSIVIAYDQCKMQWPTNWYLKSSDFPNAYFTTYEGIDNPDVILIANDSEGCGWPDSIPGYTKQVYNLRVHENEFNTYRNFAIAPELAPSYSAWGDAENPHDLAAIARSIGDSIGFALTPEGQQRLFRLVMYRDQSFSQQTYRMYVFVRDDLMPQYNEIRYGSEKP